MQSRSALERWLILGMGVMSCVCIGLMVMQFRSGECGLIEKRNADTGRSHSVVHYVCSNVTRVLPERPIYLYEPVVTRMRFSHLRTRF